MRDSSPHHLRERKCPSYRGDFYKRKKNAQNKWVWQRNDGVSQNDVVIAIKNGLPGPFMTSCAIMSDTTRTTRASSQRIGGKFCDRLPCVTFYRQSNHAWRPCAQS